MSESFLKVIKDAGLTHEQVLEILGKEGKIKDPKSYQEIYKVEEAKRLAKEEKAAAKATKKAGKDKDKDKTPPVEPAAPAEPTVPAPAEPDALTKRFDDFEAKITKLISEGSRIPLATPSTGVESKNEGDFSIALGGKYEKYV